MNKWTEVHDSLPRDSKQYIVCLCNSYYPEPPYDFCDSLHKEYNITTAHFDAEQKIWTVNNLMNLNALLPDDEQPLNGHSITHWMEFPKLPEECKNSPKVIVM